MQLKYLKHDLYRYFYPNDQVSRINLYQKVKMVIFTQGIWAIVVYRFMRWAIFEFKVPIVRQILIFAGGLLQLFIDITTGIHIQPEIDIGPGLYIGHFGGIFIGGEAKIGKFCNFSQGNTIGSAGRGDRKGVPEIGDFVYVAPGAKVIGMIKIGNHVAIGANAVVSKNLPDNAVVAGIPARIINYNSSRDFIEYNESKSKEML